MADTESLDEGAVGLEHHSPLVIEALDRQRMAPRVVWVRLDLHATLVSLKYDGFAVANLDRSRGTEATPSHLDANDLAIDQHPGDPPFVIRERREHTVVSCSPVGKYNRLAKGFLHFFQRHAAPNPTDPLELGTLVNRETALGRGDARDHGGHNDHQERDLDCPKTQQGPNAALSGPDWRARCAPATGVTTTV